jgi:hypothetical protein
MHLVLAPAPSLTDLAHAWQEAERTAEAAGWTDATADAENAAWSVYYEACRDAGICVGIHCDNEITYSDTGWCGHC